jgi:hypothetical protein
MTERNDDPQDAPKPLEYGHAEPRGGAAAAGALLCAGALTGAVATIAVGLVVGGAVVSGPGPDPRGRLRVVALLAFGAAGLMFVWFSLARRQPKRQWFFSGFLLGCGVLALLQGLCYSAIALQH